MASLPGINQLIVISIKPLVKLIVPTLCSFILTKNNLFPKAAARGLAQIVLNVTLPALLFSRIIPSFNQQNIQSLAPLMIVALFYVAMGLILGILSRYFVRIPDNFYHGFVAASAFSNWGDAPTAVLVAITSEAPFLAGDSDLAVAYISIFILVFMLTLFPCKGTYFIEKDYKDPHVSSSDIPSIKSQWMGNLLFRRKGQAQPDEFEISSKDSISLKDTSTSNTPISSTSDSLPPPIALSLVNMPIKRRLLNFIMIILILIRSILTPPTISLILALLIALILPIKALFLSTTSTPPLGILLDTATFIGNASVPCGLFVLGSAIARMKIARPYRALPWSSMLLMSFNKLVLLPVIGFFLVQGLVASGLVRKEEKVLQFTLIYFSIVPTSTTQVSLSEIYAKEDGKNNSDILAGYLIVQYIIFAFASCILTVITLTSLYS